MALNRDDKKPRKIQGGAHAVKQLFSRRDSIIVILFVAMTLWVSYHLVNLTVIKAEEYSEQGAAIRTSVLTLTARRGTIYDRNGNVLATNVDATTIYANPSKIIDPKETAELLHGILGGTTEQYFEAITDDPNATFVYIAKKVDPDLEQAIRDANQEYINEAIEEILSHGDDVPAEIKTPLTGIEFLQDTRREYPNGSTGAQVIGSVNDEGTGVSGLEQAYDCILRGVDGRRVIEVAKQVSQNSSPLPMIDSILEEIEPIQGNDIIISLDIEMQQYLELNLQVVASQRNTDNASAILLDGSTGEIIATASIPLYDREKVTEEEVALGATNAKAITQPYEPGSTFKVVIAAAALEQGLMTAEDVLFCPAYLEIYDKTIKDSVDRPDMEMSLRHIIANSSNIGVSLIEQQLGSELFYEYLMRLGLGEYTHVDYPGETPGTLADVAVWTPVQAANIAFGQGLEVSLLQMASIFGAIANDGVMMQPHFLIARPQYDVELSYDSRQVFEAQTTRDLEEILRSCVTEGYGVNAEVYGFDTVGKTGTAEIGSFSGGYGSAEGSYVCSFAGYLDNSTSNYVFMSSFENPTNYADSPATTFFSVVMSFVANRYMIQPQAEAPIVQLREGQTSSLKSEVSDMSDAGAPYDGAATYSVSSLSGVTATSGISAPSTGASSSGASQRDSETAIVSPTPRDWLLDTSG